MCMCVSRQVVVTPLGNNPPASHPAHSQAPTQNHHRAISTTTCSSPHYSICNLDTWKALNTDSRAGVRVSGNLRSWVYKRIIDSIRTDVSELGTLAVIHSGWIWQYRYNYWTLKLMHKHSCWHHTVSVVAISSTALMAKVYEEANDGTNRTTLVLGLQICLEVK